MHSLVILPNEVILAVAEEMFLLNARDFPNLEPVSISEKYEAGEGNSSTIFLGLK